MRPAFLRVQTALEDAGGLADTKNGWAAYARHLEWHAATGPAGKNAAYVNLSKGWALGTAGFKADLVASHNVTVSARALEQHGAEEIRRMRWEQACAAALAKLPAAARKAADSGEGRRGQVLPFTLTIERAPPGCWAWHGS